VATGVSCYRKDAGEKIAQATQVLYSRSSATCLGLGRLFSGMIMFLPAEQDARVFRCSDGDDHGRACNADEEQHFHKEFAHENHS
jgi:hypothetical protein